MLYRFIIELSDIDGGKYESLDFRVSQHPSEGLSYLLTRVLAYALSYQEGLQFAPKGLGDPDAPALLTLGLQNQIETWIEIGNAPPRKLHKASKLAKQITVYTYKNPKLLIDEIRSNTVHRSEKLKIYSFDEKFISALEQQLEKTNRWTLVIQQNEISLSNNDQTISTELRQHRVND